MGRCLILEHIELRLHFGTHDQGQFGLGGKEGPSMNTLGLGHLDLSTWELLCDTHQRSRGVLQFEPGLEIGASCWRGLKRVREDAFWFTQIKTKSGGHVTQSGKHLDWCLAHHSPPSANQIIVPNLGSEVQNCAQLQQVRPERLGVRVSEAS